MKNCTLDVATRLRLTGFLNQVSGPVGRIRPLISVVGKLALTEAEMKQVKFEDVGGGRTQVSIAPDLSAIALEFEDAEAAAVVTEIEQTSTLTVADLMMWADNTLKQLKGSQ